VAKSRGILGGGAGRDPGLGMDIDDQAFLDQIEQNIRGKDDEKDVARKEAEQRAAEMERVRKASANIPIPGKRPIAETPAPPAAEKKNPFEDDPRYKEYFERLKRQKGETLPSSTTPAAGITRPAVSSVPASTKSDSRSVGPGAIVRFDDGSIGVYKDAVSGRDYALFYFLQPDGQFVPEGVFLQSYQAKVIGHLPENYFSELRDKSSWDRDLIVFHLNEYEHVGFLNNLAEHEERKPKNTTPAKNTVVTPVPASPEPQKSAAPANEAQPQSPEPAPVPASVEATPTSNEGLVKGRKFQIKFGGKQWEAVYWTSDEQGAIVAHATHGNWSLMRLDLERFKDSLELGEIVDGDTMTAIAESAAST